MANQIDKQLRPLYLSIFCETLIFWYAIEKAFMRDIGFNDATTGMLLTIMVASTLLLEIPSGILSDRWSRKGTLMLGLIALLISTIGGGLSHSVPTYTFFIAIWGIYAALRSGIKKSIIYDVLLENQGDASNFTKYYGRVELIGGIALTLGSLSSSLITLKYSKPATFLFTTPIILLSIAALYFFKEPKVHKTNQKSSLLEHTKQTFREVLRQPALYLLVATIVAAGVMARLIFGFAQWWWMPLGLALPLFGVFDAALNLAGSAAGFFAKKTTEKNLFYLALGATISSLLLTIRNIVFVELALILLLANVYMIEIVLSKKLNDNLSSTIRAGAGSVIGFLVSAVSLLFLSGFGYLAERHSIFSAAWVVIALALFIACGTIIRMSRPNRFV